MKGSKGWTTDRGPASLAQRRPHTSAAYRAIYSKAPLQRYQLSAVPPIHIIVKNGNITLEGVVANEGDKNLAGIAAKGVSGAFGVKSAGRNIDGRNAP